MTPQQYRPSWRQILAVWGFWRRRNAFRPVLTRVRTVFLRSWKRCVSVFLDYFLAIIFITKTSQFMLLLIQSESPIRIRWPVFITGSGVFRRSISFVCRHVWWNCGFSSNPFKYIVHISMSNFVLIYLWKSCQICVKNTSKNNQFQPKSIIKLWNSNTRWNPTPEV